MKTNAFALDLMVPDQAHKDILFNESMLKIDQFLNISINGFIKDIPKTLNVGEKLIICEGIKKNHICFLLHDSKKIEFLKPTNGMIVFSIQQSCFYLFDDKWLKINIGSEIIAKNFDGIEGEYIAPIDVVNHYLYLSKNTTIILKKSLVPELTLIIKQNSSTSFAFKWPDNILWENGKEHIMTNKANAIDIVKLFQLPESNHFLGKIISQNHQF
jgi:hypothetical protein